MGKIIDFSIVECSSESQSSPASNLTNNDHFKKWTTSKPTKKAYITIKFDTPINIKTITIANNGSANVEIIVHNDLENISLKGKTLLHSVNFMTMNDIQSGNNKYKQRKFKTDQLDSNVVLEKWQYVRIICSQPFPPPSFIGLSFLQFKTQSQETSDPMSIDLPTTSSSSIDIPMLDDEDLTLNDDPVLFTQAPKPPSPQPTRTASTSVGSSSSSLARSSHNDSSRIKSLPKSLSSESTTKTVKTKTNPSSTKPSTSSSSSNSKKSSISSTLKTKSNNRSKSESKQNSSQTHRKPLQGVVLVIGGIPNPERSELRDAVLRLGGEYRPNWGRDATHLVLAGSLNTDKAKSARNDLTPGKEVFLVSKDWVYACRDENNRVNESSFEVQTSNRSRTRVRTRTRNNTKKSKSSSSSIINDHNNDSDEEENDEYENEGIDSDEDEDDDTVITTKMKDDDEWIPPVGSKRKSSSDNKQSSSNKRQKKNTENNFTFEDIIETKDNNNNDLRTSQDKLNHQKQQKHHRKQNLNSISRDELNQEQQQKQKQQSKSEMNFESDIKLEKIPKWISSDVNRLVKYFSKERNDFQEIYNILQNIFQQCIRLLENGKEGTQFFDKWEHNTAAPKGIRKALRSDANEESIRLLNFYMNQYLKYFQMNYLFDKETQSRSSSSSRSEKEMVAFENILKDMFYRPPPLPSFLCNVIAYFDPNVDSQTRHSIHRYLIAYGATIQGSVNDDTTHIILPFDANSDYEDKYAAFIPQVKAVDTDWVLQCHQSQRQVKEDAFLSF